MTRAAVLIVTLGAAAACGRGSEQLVAPTNAFVVVHAVLDAGSRTQLVLVELGRSGSFAGASSFGDKQQPVTSAVVALTTPDGRRLTATEDRVTSPKGAILGQYRLSLDTYGVSLIPGGTYTLTVTTPGGVVVTGTTTIPRVTPAAANALELFARDVDTLRMSWPRVDGALL